MRYYYYRLSPFRSLSPCFHYFIFVFRTAVDLCLCVCLFCCGRVSSNACHLCFVYLIFLCFFFVMRGRCLYVNLNLNYIEFAWMQNDFVCLLVYSTEFPTFKRTHFLYCNTHSKIYSCGRNIKFKGYYLRALYNEINLRKRKRT